MDKLAKDLPESYYGFIYHYYRAEVYRETAWRNRLDVTTNWSIVVTAGLISFVFSNPHVSHSAILVNYLVVWFFLYIESRRFRYYTMLRQRTRVLEKHLLAPIFSKTDAKVFHADWMEPLKSSLLNPKVSMSRVESLTWRMRRNYVIIFPLLFAVWLAKINNSPVSAQTAQDLFSNARVWFIPGEFVFATFLVTVVFTLALAFYIPNASHEDDLP